MLAEEMIKILKQHPGYSVGVEITVNESGRNYTESKDIEGLADVWHLDKILTFDLEN